MLLLATALLSPLGAAAATELTGEQLAFRSAVMNFLRSEGFVPKVDTRDESIEFKKEGERYWIYVEESSPFYVTLQREGYSIEADQAAKSKEIANRVNRTKKAAKVYVSEASVTFVVEMFAPSAESFEKVFYHKVQLELKKFNYTDAELVLEAFEDFLKGPQFIMQRGMAEQRFMDANRKREKLKAFDEIRDDCMKLGVDLDSLDVEDVTIDYPRSRKNAMLDFATFNGQRLGWLVQYTNPESVAVIDAAGGSYQPGKMRQCDTIVAIDVHSRQGVIRKKDDARFKALWRRYNDDVKEFKKREKQLKSDYENARSTMTSVEFWKKYLGLEDDGGNDKVDE